MAHIYWRLHTLTGYYGCVAEWKMYDGTGTQIATTGGTASADNSANGAAANAFDGSASTMWCPSGPSTFPHWLQYQFASAVDVVSFSIATRNDGLFDEGPMDVDLQYSDDGSTWTTRYSYRGVGWTSAGQTITFNSSNVNPTSLGIAWRLVFNSVYGGGDASVYDWTLRDGGGTAIATTSYAAIASDTFLGTSGGTPPYFAFDGNSSTAWSASTSSVPQTLEYRFAGAQSVGSFCITAGTGGRAVPSSVTLQYSFDDTNWTSVATETPANITTQQCFTLGGTFPVAGTISASPSAGVQGNVYAVTITGTSTHFASGVTTVSFSGSGGTVSGVSVASATSLTFTLTLSGSAALGAQTITVTTGAEAPSATFTVVMLSGGAGVSNYGFVS